MLGSIFVLTPTVGWMWPALLPLATAAAAAIGYRRISEGELDKLLKSRLTRKLEQIRRVSVPIDEVLAEVVSEDLGTDERVMFEKDNFILVFRKDARGKFFVDVSGPKSETPADLKRRGEAFAHEVIKKFAYHKMVEQIERRGATIVQETQTEDGELKLRSRQWR